MSAGRSVSASAGTELDLALVEVFLEVGPLLGGDGCVLLRRPQGPPALQEQLVVPDQVFLEDSDVATSGLQIQMAQQCSADMDRQAAVNEFGGE